MKKTVMLSIFALLLALCLPLAFGAGRERAPAAVTPEVSAAMQTEPPPAASPTAPAQDMGFGVRDSELYFSAKTGDRLSEYTMAEYLPGVLAAEMPASFEGEALKAQAVAARTYILNRAASGPVTAHPEADVCDDVFCCKAYLAPDALRERWGDQFDACWQKISAAVAATDGCCILYEGSPIQAVFHSSTSGMTESSGNVWSPVPYLISVSSPESEADVPHFVSAVEVSEEEFKRTVSASYPDAALDGDPSVWLEDAGRYDSGRVAYVTLGGVQVTGAELRRMFALRSTSFTLEYADGRFLFTVSGYGHGVGLSQYGANVMARQGASYAEILAHYYPGTALSQAQIDPA